MDKLLKFERDDNATNLINIMLGNMEPGKRMIVFTATEGMWQFMLNYDEMHDQWTASYRTANAHLKPGERYSALPCEPPLAITGKKYRYYKTRDEAEGAALRKLQSLNN